MSRLVAVALLLLTGCTAREAHLAQATAIARAAGLAPYRWQAGGLSGLGFAAWGGGGRVLTVYIEGDGRAWVNPWQPATDPTPGDPLALRLAAADPRRPLLYLARPCQFVMAAACNRRLWTGDRLSPAVVAAFQQVIDRARRRAGSARIGLVGYSGGGALATLLAERRRDVAWLVTVAGDLDLAAWVRLQHLAPLSGSLDPAADAAAIGRLPQVHFAGARDAVVPPEIVADFLALLPPAAPARLIVVPGFDHRCCWEAAWPRLLRRARPGPAAD